jgi:hypothetical protein
MNLIVEPKFATPTKLPITLNVVLRVIDHPINYFDVIQPLQ